MEINRLFWQMGNACYITRQQSWTHHNYAVQHGSKTSKFVEDIGEERHHTRSVGQIKINYQQVQNQRTHKHYHSFSLGQKIIIKCNFFSGKCRNNLFCCQGLPTYIWITNRKFSQEFRRPTGVWLRNHIVLWDFRSKLPWTNRMSEKEKCLVLYNCF